MATAYITEYAELADDAQGHKVAVGKEPAVTTQKVSFTTATQSSAFNARTRFVLIDFEDAAHVKIDGNPAATANHPKKAAGSAQFFGVRPSDKASFYDGVS